MTTSGIYEIRNKVTGVSYIGSSINTEVRKRQHIYALRKGKHPAKYMQNAWNKHGEDAFEFRVLEEVSDVTLLVKREQYWMNVKRPRYNSRTIAESNRGVKESPEATQAKRERQLGVPRSPETIEKIKTARAKQEFTPGMLDGLKKGWEARGESKSRMKGLTHSDETKRKMAEQATGRKHTPETLEKMRAAKLGTKQTPELIEKRVAPLRGRKHTAERIEKQAASNRETWAKKSVEEKHRIATNRPPVSEETKRRQREAHLGKTQDVEAIKLRIDASYRNKSEEEKAATRAKRKATWEAKRQTKQA